MAQNGIYEKLIGEMCEVVGVNQADEIVQTQHVKLGDRIIGLIPDTDSDPPTLSVYIEAGQTYPERDTRLYVNMLAANLAANPGAPGVYAVHPDTLRAVYRTTLEMGATTGANLAELIEAQIEATDSDMARFALEA